MRRELCQVRKLYHYDDDGKRVAGQSAKLSGDCSSLSGDCSGLSGDCSGLWGDCSGLWGSLADCQITDAEREAGVAIADLVKGTHEWQ